MNGRTGELEGVAIFDIHGDAVMKFYKKDDTDNKAWDDLFQTVPANGTPKFQPKKPQPNRFDPSKKEEFLEAWKNLKDTHDFFMLLMRYGITRTKALEVAEGSFAYKMHNEASVDLLSRVSKAGMPLMVFIGNKGIIQIHDGIIDKNFTQGGWLNIMDPEFNMHLDMAKVAECWHVVKPTVDGDVNSVELYDSEGELLVTFFSSRKPGTPEREIWRTIIEEIKTNQKELSNA
jgi:putative hemin transport protein